MMSWSFLVSHAWFVIPNRLSGEESAFSSAELPALVKRRIAPSGWNDKPQIRRQLRPRSSARII
jgi:hypothetical protein